MHTSLGGAVMVVAGLLFVAAPATARAGAYFSTQQQTATVKRLLVAVNGHRLHQVQGNFTPSSLVQVGTRQWRGRPNVVKWWRGEFNHALRISPRSAFTVTRNEVKAIVHRQTRGGDCSKGCDEQAAWRFSGSRIDRMVLTPLRAPVPPRIPTISVPPPPTAPPSPHVTPTIPS